ncbi:hypothetical protein AEM42_13340 [Betaproteobacteria bacterium UKL13-2]|nr:hypothetical protein AEM42_13340 [Betaproteobacteria bacterium UKL13-2]HCG52716.1 hypothetical protein [Betaproteobacteria bacterium]
MVNADGTTAGNANDGPEAPQTSTSVAKVVPVPQESGEGVNTDGRAVGEFKSRYPFSVRAQIFTESLYLGLILLVGVYLIVWMYNGGFPLPFSCIVFDSLPETLKTVLSFPIGGLIGGTLFALKYLYRVAARGFWSVDRRIWRLFSPWLSATLALMVGIMIDGGVLGLTYSVKPGGSIYSITVSVGFITGYFADSALAKMQDIANVIFGAPSRHGSRS